MNLTEIITKVDQLKAEVDALRPLNPEQEQRIMQKLRLDWNYHSNALEGNTLSPGETKAFLLHGITAKGKPFRDYLDIKGHNEAIIYLEEFIRGQRLLTEADIREIHKILLVEPYEVDAITPAGQPTKRRIAIGQYKTMPNHVRTTTGEMHYYATPEETPAKMGDLMKWYRQQTQKGELHPLILAATFHYQFVTIHPFDDGNGRMARLLMNLILMRAGYVPVVVRIDTRTDYLLALEKADTGELEDFINLIGEVLIHSLELYLRGAKGESIEELDDLDKKVALLQRKLGFDLAITTEKNLATQKNLFNHLIQPFLKKLFSKFEQFEIFFTQTSFRSDIRDNRQSPHFNNPTHLLNKLPSIIEDAIIDELDCTYELITFMSNRDYELRVNLSFNLRKYDFDIRYTLSESYDQEPPETELTRGVYDRLYTEEEVNELVLLIANQMYTRIEQASNQQTS
jgi:Fic family protein